MQLSVSIKVHKSTPSPRGLRSANQVQSLAEQARRSPAGVAGLEAGRQLEINSGLQQMCRFLGRGRGTNLFCLQIESWRLAERARSHRHLQCREFPPTSPVEDLRALFPSDQFRWEPNTEVCVCAHVCGRTYM